MSLFKQIEAALYEKEPHQKVALTYQLFFDWQDGKLQIEHDYPVQGIGEPGRPDRPELVLPKNLLRRKVTSAEGRAVLIHALTHIEFNAINLALDAAYRFRNLPDEFYSDWLTIAKEEAYHFSLLRAHLQQYGHDYGDYPAHNGLWEMAQNTADDVMVRMALVPRCLEARGLDVTPGIQKKLVENGDSNAATLLDVIFRDEVGHVAIGNRWFRTVCEQRGVNAEQTYLELLHQHKGAQPRPPFHHDARIEAGFSESELKYLESAF
ncbi:MAG: ferritin-like domain-containing protein [Gammaproteobacteria bacterium]|nr:ferritin-like domain-containing protein [Gammaproteobacteria bacterium]